MFEAFTPDARAVLESTTGYAIALGHNYIGTEHLLLALAGAEEARGSGPLLARGVTVDRARRVIGEYLETIPSDADALHRVGVDPHAVRDAAGRAGVAVRIGGLTPWEPDPSTPEELRRVTPRARAILQAAERAGGTEATCDDLLAAMIDGDTNLGVVVLEKLGVSIEELRADLGR
jgi:ATP-dependent Clp protease ATP-binding subunit ClpC